MKMENKLELHHLAPYLPYGLRVIKGNGFTEMLSAYNDGKDYISVLQVVRGMGKPLLVPVSELNASNQDFVDICEWLYGQERDNFDGIYGVFGWFDIKKDDLLNLPYKVVNKLFEYHFDVFGLIEKSLAINKLEAK